MLASIARTKSFLTLAALALLLAAAPGCAGIPFLGGGEPVPEVNGLVTLRSERDFDDTFNRLRNAIESNDDLMIVETVDHAANARRAGLELPPTRLIIFGNPDLGTPLMQAERTVAIDLPQKFLVWEDGDGRAYVSYNDPAYLARRHGIEGRGDVLRQVSDALRNLAERATR